MHFSLLLHLFRCHVRAVDLIDIKPRNKTEQYLVASDSELNSCNFGKTTLVIL